MNGIERDLRGRAEVIRLNLLSRVGREVATTHQVTGVPATIVFDGAGTASYRVDGLPSRKTVVERVIGL